MRNDGNPSKRSEQAILRDVVDDLRAHIEYQRSTGVESFPRRLTTAPAPLPTGPPAVAVTPRAAPRATAQDTVMESGDAPLVDAGGLQTHTLEELRAEIGDCQRCKLCSGRTHIVFGVGNPQAALMFVGEGPGRDEDLRGEPFVGRAGQLLTEIITKGMKLRREDVYIANVIKCRPPQNRNPESDEIAACEPFLQRQIDIVRPRVLVALGTFAAQTLLGVRTPISRLRGQWHAYRGIKLMPTLHPAYLLRNPADKKLVWNDIKMVITELETPR